MERGQVLFALAPEKAEKRENTLTVIPNHGRLYQCAAQRGYK